MSVLKTIRGAFDNVQHDISESFKSITAKTAKSKQTKIPLKIDGVDLDAGADLLNKFQEQWENIHSESEANAKKAQEVDIRVSGLFVSCEHQNESLNYLVTLVAGLPQLLNEINQVSRKLELLEEEFRHVSDGISELENLNEEIDIAENKNHHKQQLQMYKERKNRELEQAKVTFAEEHARKARGYEAKLQEKIQERQQVFEDAFKEEIENYKRHGKTQMKPQLTNTVAEDLADITIEEDKDKGVLNEFLKSDDLDAPSSTQKEVGDVAKEELTSEDEADDDSPKLHVVADEDIEEEIIPVKQEHGAVEINADIANSFPAEDSQGEHFESDET